MFVDKNRQIKNIITFILGFVYTFASIANNALRSFGFSPSSDSVQSRLSRTSSQNIAHLRPAEHRLGSFEPSMRSKGERPGIWDTGKTRLRGILFSLAVVRVLVMLAEGEGDRGRGGVG
ncbi:hypothetical protein V1477_009526 [Vespula maculifrons]|uniref:Uncharacterized protein n=1 Tax=Vespula maculifrons TaxID=7453 RepID=A0ABD2CA02_VESMC